MDLRFAPILFAVGALGAWWAYSTRYEGGAWWLNAISSLLSAGAWVALVRWGRSPLVTASVLYDACMTASYLLVLFGRGERLSLLQLVGLVVALVGCALMQHG